jgi:hypothetical protein
VRPIKEESLRRWFGYRQGRGRGSVAIGGRRVVLSRYFCGAKLRRSGGG